MEHLSIPGWEHFYSGKVRDLYKKEGDDSILLIVASDRVSAFDHMLEPPINGKGALLTKLSNWWFNQLPFANHLTTTDTPLPNEVAERSTVSRALEMLPIECVVRGAITGSGYAEYLETGSVCGIQLPEGLGDGDLLPEPIFTPAYKAPLGEHDENITFAKTIDIVGEETAIELQRISLEIFNTASKIAGERGLILADTKFEFGLDKETGVITLADEVLTSDSSRYWDAEIYTTKTGPARLSSFDKQIVRDWLKENWNKEGVPPPLPETIVERTRNRYQELLKRFTSSSR